MRLRSAGPPDEEDAKWLQFPKRPRKKSVPKAKEENDKYKHFTGDQDESPIYHFPTMFHSTLGLKPPSKKRS